MSPPPALRVMARFAQALSLHQAGELGAAREAYLEVLDQQPGHGGAARLLAALEMHERRHAQAAQWFRRALESAPRDAALLVALGRALAGDEQWREALRSFDAALSLEPTMAEAHAFRAVALRLLRCPAQALRAFERAMAIDPAAADAWLHHAALLDERGRHAQALASFARHMASDPPQAMQHLYHGLCLKHNGRWSEALACYERALSLAPASGEANYCKAYAMLALGDWERGWPLHETWRWQCASLQLVTRSFPQPRWTGEQSLAGKTVLLHNDQGLGDGIMMSRFAPELVRRGARVVLEVQRALVPLLRTLEGPKEVLPSGAALPAFDFHCPLFSLPAALALRRDGMASSEPYLRADAALVARWAERLGPRRGAQRVGMAMSGNPRHKNDKARSIGMARWLAAMPPGCDYVSLQRELRPADRRALRSAQPPVRHFGRWLHDFSETAALCEQMDLVISVDTSVAHLAAALGKPTWILLPVGGDFRWGIAGEACPWYRSARLFRQGADRDWAPVLGEVGAQLRALAGPLGQAA